MLLYKDLVELGETMSICWSTGPRPYFKQKKKIIVSQNFGQLAFFFNLFFSAFRKKKEEIKHKFILITETKMHISLL